MYEYLYEIGGVVFRTLADFQIENYQNNFFSQYITKNCKYNVTFEFIGIPAKKLVLPPLNSSEIKFISRFLSPSHIGCGILVIPPIIQENENISNLTTGINSYSDLPLLRSTLVRKKIFSFKTNPFNVLLSLHLFSVVIYNFKISKIQIFYLLERRSFLNKENLENGIRRLFTSFFPSNNGVLLHSSGIIRSKKALLFFAPDEGGKTTAIKNSTKDVFLSDDRNIIKKEKDKLIAYSTPWGSIKTSSKKAEIGALFLLKKAKKFKLVPVKPNDMLQFIWDEHIHIWDILPIFSRVSAFNILYEICHKIPIYKMYFPKNFVDWEAIDLAIKN
jgi:hypothetical protein